MAYITKKTTVNGVKPIGSNLFGTCSTASGTAQKDVTMADFDVLVSGVTIHVYFANRNTASNPTLKVGSTSAVAISCNGATEGNWEDGAVISFTYNGSWIQNDASESGATYTLSKSGDTITLTGSDGSTSSVTDSDTILKYTADAPDGATTNNVVQNDVTNNVASGGYSLAEGIGTTASGLYSHAEGQGTTASGDRSHAEGNGSTASGHSSRAEGNGTIASGNHSHAEGNASVASGSGSHAEGSHTEASRDVAHAEGYYSVASGNRSFAGNNYTIAQRADQTVIGRMNIADAQGADGGELGEYAFIIGNGNADDDRSNAFTVDWQGRVECGDYSGAFKSLFDIFYPVGSYYETTDATFDPNTAWGGTWVSEVVTDDEVIEEVNSPNGTTSGWSYRKWKSGISECWGRTIAANYAMTNPYGNGHYVGKNPIATFPSIFISPPIVNITRTNVGTGGGLVFASIYATTATSCSAYVFNSRSESASLQFSMYARGLWKTYTAPTNTYRWHRTA